jgi:ParB-like chromosome segregation protein Spo0J
MLVEERPVGEIKPYTNNPRLNDAAVEAVAASIREFGWRVPIVCDEAMVIVAGHTRYKAALKLGLAAIPVHVARGLTPAQVKAYRIADNQTATLSGWHDELLVKELAALQELDFDLELTGFSADDLLRLLQPDATPGLTDPDEVPEPPDEPRTKPGDLWLLGDHRLLCGDSARAEDVDRLLAGSAVQLLNTDPPYGVAVEPRSNNAVAAGLSSFESGARPTSRKLRAKDRPIANDSAPEEEYGRLLRAWFGNAARSLEPGRAFYVWGGYGNCGSYPPALKAAGLYFSQGLRSCISSHSDCSQTAFGPASLPSTAIL